MKAEQRKELETNALADRMGHLVQRMKTQPRRSTLYYVLGGIAVMVIVFLIARWFQVSRQENSQRWFMINNGTKTYLEQLAVKEGETNPGKAARFQFAWMLYWEGGVKRLGVGNGSEAITRMDEAAELYKKLAQECASDPFWEPEALYGLAVIEETHAIQNLDALDSAKKLYEDLATKHKDSARGKLAADWVANYDNKEKKEQLQQFYQEMHTALGIVDPALQERIEEFRKNLKLDPKNLKLDPKKAN